MDITKTNNLIKYILAFAGQQDTFVRELGPIHIIKYVYIADMTYAEEHDGQSYTGANWIFHHYGPWSVEVYKQINNVVEETGALEKVISNPKYDDDFKRWYLDDEALLEHMDRILPFEITIAINRAVHEFGNDTTSLLEFVYNTTPILKAAPGEILSFESKIPTILSVSEQVKPELTYRQIKNRKEMLKEMRDCIQARLAERKLNKLKRITSPTPRYDDVFFEGQNWLNSLAGDLIENQEGELQFSDEIWKSSWRFNPDVS